MDSFRILPFWKQWNALIQFNVEKNKFKPGVYILPESYFYHHYPYNNIHYPYPLHGGGFPSVLGGAGPILMDELKPPASPAMVYHAVIT